MFKTLIKHKDVLKICTTKYFGKNLSSEQRLKAEDLLSTMYPEMIFTYLSYFWRRLTLSPNQNFEKKHDKYLQQFGGKV